MNEGKALRNLGLTQSESQVYLSLLQLGDSPAGIISSHAQLHRKNTYDALYRLEQVGLVSSFLEQRTRQWRAAHPERIRELLDERISHIEVALPKLVGMFSQHRHSQNVQLYLGTEGLKTVFQHIASHAKQLSVVGATGNIYDSMQYFAPNFIEAINERDVSARILLMYKAKYKKRHLRDFPNATFRVLPKDFRAATQLFVYGLFCAVVIWSAQPICVLIESEAVAEGFFDHFSFLWNISEPLFL